jgi:hypothetical protein
MPTTGRAGEQVILKVNAASAEPLPLCLPLDREWLQQLRQTGRRPPLKKSLDNVGRE